MKNARPVPKNQPSAFALMSMAILAANSLIAQQAVPAIALALYALLSSKGGAA